MKVLGIDIGGTRIKYGTIENQKVVNTEIIATPQNTSALVEKLCEIIDASLDVSFAGIGVPGMVDADGTVHFPPNLPFLDGLNIKFEIEKLTGKKVIVENDANLIALGEWRYGSGQKASHTIVITLGTGVGTGIIVDGKLLRGANGWAGEGGHMIIDTDGPECYCGNRGCLESFIGTTHFIPRAKKFINDDQLDAEKLFQLATRGNTTAIRLWDEYGYWLGIGITNLVHLFSPSRVVLTGGVAKAFDSFKESLMKTLKQKVIGYSERNLKVVPGTLAEQASLYGVLYLSEESTKNG